MIQKIIKKRSIFSSHQPEFYQPRLFGAVEIKKNPLKNLKRLLKLAKPDNGLRDAGKDWPW